MSYNQSRPDRNENQYRKTGRSTSNYNQQPQQQQRSSTAGYNKVPGGTGTSFKKTTNAQTSNQPRVNLPPPVNQNNHNVQLKSQGPSGEQVTTIPKAPAKAVAPADSSKAFAFQFGSIGPDLMKVPARTFSAPPSVDEQKRAQMQQDSLRTVAQNKAAENHQKPSNEKVDVQVVQHVSHHQKSPPVTNIRMPSVQQQQQQQQPYPQHGQVTTHPIHFGGPPGLHMQQQQVPPTATSFQMPIMPMGLSMGNTPPQVFFQHPIHGPMHHPQGMMHQGPPPQGHGFPPPQQMGGQIHHPQLRHVGVNVGMGPQYPQQPQQQQQQGGKFVGTTTRKTTPVKITHPDTHEELRLDRRAEAHTDGESKLYPNTPPRSFAQRPVNLMQTGAYNANPMIYPQGNSGPRYPFDGQQQQRVQFTNQSAHTAPPPHLIRPAAPPAHVSTSSVKAQPSALPVTEKVTVKQATAPEKVELPKAVKNEETVSLSSVPVGKPSVETAPVAVTEIVKGETLKEPESVEDQKQTSKVEPETIVEPLVSETIAAKESSSLTAANGPSKQLPEVSPTSGSLDTNLDKTTEDKDLQCVEQTVSENHIESSVSSDEKQDTTKPQNEVNGPTDSEKLDEVAASGVTTSEVPSQSSTAPLVTVSKDKPVIESNLRRNTSTKGKKKIKEILQKADAAGTTSDLYMAYKGPEETKEIEKPSESSNVIEEVVETPTVVEAEPVKNELEDWEDAADVSTPKLQTLDHTEKQDFSSDDVRDKKYSRDFLLKFADMFTTLPEGFDITPDIASTLLANENDNTHQTPGKGIGSNSGARLDRRSSNVVVDDRWTKNNQGSFRQNQGPNSGVLRNPRMQQQGPIMSNRPMQQPMGRNNQDMWQRGANFQQKGLFPSPHQTPTPMQIMHKAERKYQVGTVADEEQAKQRQLKGILNKLTPQNFEKLFEQVKNVNIDNAVTLIGVISQIFDKALMEPTFCEMYADFCYHLSGALPELIENGEKMTFKRLLLNKCQEEFERGEKEEEEASRVAEEETEEEREEKRLKVRRRMLGNIRLIGELYKKKMLTEKIMHACILKLLGYDQNPHEENIEALCKLMSTIGVMIDHPKAKIHIDAYFERMFALSRNQELSSRVRFMLKNAIDLRKNKWHERMKVEGPKKIEDVHRDAAQERQTQANRLSRGPSMGSSSRRGHMEYSPRGGGGMLSPPSQQMGGYHGHGRVGYGNQDIRMDERQQQSYEPRMVPMPQRSVGGGEEPIMLGPQGGLGQGMAFRRPAVALNTDVGDSGRRPGSGGGLNGYGSQRPASPVTHGPQVNPGAGYVHREFASRAPDHPPSEASSARQGLQSPREDALTEKRLEDMSLSAIKEYYSARDEKEIGLCMKDMNSPAFHPTMISLWVNDSFQRKDKERDLLAKLLVSLVKSADNALTDVQLVKGFESVLKTLEEEVSDAPKAAEFLGRIFGRSVTEKVVTLTEIGRLILEGGEEPGSLIEYGLGGDVLGSVLEVIKTEGGEEALVEILGQSSGLRIVDFQSTSSKPSKILEKFT